MITHNVAIKKNIIFVYKHITPKTLKTTSFFLSIVPFIIFGCNGQKANNVSSVAVAEFTEQLTATPNAQLLDVRTPKEYLSQHIDNAVNINWNDAQFTDNVAKLDKSKTVFIYCLSGGRSLQAANKLSEMGFSKIVDLQGGILKWNAQNHSQGAEPEKIIGICPQEYKELLVSNKKTIVNFYAEWCAPCKIMAPYLLKMQKELAGKISLVRYNADENKTIMKALNIDELPVIMIYENDKLVYSHNGFLSEEDLRKQIQ